MSEKPIRTTPKQLSRCRIHWFFPTPVLLLGFQLVCSTYSFGSSSEVPWQQIAESDIICTGSIDSISDEKSGSKSIVEKAYAKISFKIEKCLKGAQATSIVVRVYITDKNIGTVKLLGSKPRRTFFLVNVGAGSIVQTYFTGSITDSAVEGTSDWIERLTNAIDFQRQILTDKLYNDFPLDQTKAFLTRTLVDGLVIKSSQFESALKIEKEGLGIVPYLILLLDDYRQLPIRQLSLENKNGDAFEGVRHYSPVLVVDILAALLNQITGASFGFIYNGSTDEERKKVIASWKIYLYYHVKGYTEI